MKAALLETHDLDLHWRTGEITMDEAQGPRVEWMDRALERTVEAHVGSNGWIAR